MPEPTFRSPAGRVLTVHGDPALLTIDRMHEFGRRIDTDPRIVSLSLVANDQVTDRWLRASAPAGAVIAIAADAADLVGPLPEPGDPEQLRQWCIAAAERGLWHDWLLTNHRDVARATVLLEPAEIDEREALDPSSSHFITTHSQPLKARNLTLVVDATWLGPHQTGAQVLTTEAVEALARDERIASITLIGIQELPDYASHLLDLPKVHLAAADESSLDAPADVIWYPNQIDGRNSIVAAREYGRRVVTTYLDLIAYDIPRYHASPDAWSAYRSLQRRIALSVDGITTISADVALRLHEETPRLEADRVHAIPLGLDHITAATAPQAPDDDIAELVQSLGGRRFVLVLGNDFQHKNRDFAIAVWQRVLQEGEACDLVLAGLHVRSSSSKPAEDQLRARHVDLRGSVHSVGHVTPDSRAWLLANAHAVLYPSSAEGFGFVPYEAAALGTPSTFAGFGPLAEISGVPGAPRLWTIDAFAADLVALLREPQAADLRIAHLRAAIARYSWDVFAGRLVDCFQHVVAMPTVLTSTVASTASADATLAAITASRSYRLAERVRRLRLRRG
ncbi:MAG: glycosyltransferase [Candidatus Nanopelagicales bacterium]|nr:glycosyltransferase [Candidatus Nanopelagicales bacterium]